jgi:hypothetical protein
LVGVWTINATAYTGTEESGYVAAAKGSATITVTSGETLPLAIIPGPITGGDQGTFAYFVQIPYGLDNSELILTKADGTATETIILSYYAGTSGVKDLDPGQYLVRIRLQKGTGPAATYAGLTEALHIYSGLTSVLPDQVFDADDFVAAVSDFDLTILAPAPVFWETPVTSFISDQYSGTIAWKESDDSPMSAGVFGGDKVYKAVVTLTATSQHYTFTGVPENSFAHSGADTVVNAADSGVVTIAFPPTEAQFITGVAVSPSSVSAAQGKPHLFAATVEGTTINVPQGVTWTVEGNGDEGTAIAADGTLTIAINETAPVLTVKATSIADLSQYGAATVTVTTAPVIDIASNADLAKIGADPDYPLGGKYRLTADITLSDWTPIGDEAAPFFGVLDGNGRKITLQSFDAGAATGKAYLGIFGYVKGGSAASKAGIKNLVVNSQINQTNDPAIRQVVGTLAGYAANTEIEDIALQGSFTFGSSKTIYLGGIAGYIQTGTVVKDSRVTANLVIASGNGPSPTNVTGTPAQAYSFIGGVAGIFAGGGEILNSHNTGNIQAFSTVSASQVFAGGIAGGSYYGFGAAYQGKIEDCSYTGNLHAKAMGFWTFAGGIAGTIVGGTTASIDSTTRIVRSFATGTISVEGTNSGNPYIGGIVGYNYYGALVSQSYFAGDVVATKSGDYTGGIAGYNSQTGAPNNSRIEDCWSSGTVTGFNNAGGIVGQNQINTYIRRCYSTAAVTATNTGATGVGGIAGYNASVQEDAVTGNFALNPSLSIGSGTSANIHRIAGNNVANIKLTKNYAWSGMTMTRGEIAVAPTDIGANTKDGADIATNPSQADYETLGWDFTGVWTMDSYGYPKLQWQTADTPRAPLAGPVPVVSVVNNNYYDTLLSDYTTNQGGKLTVSWTLVPGATSYDIYYAPRVTTAPEISDAVAVTGVTGTSREITDSAIGENTMNYYVWIKANNLAGSSAPGALTSTLDRFIGMWTAENEMDGFLITNADALYLMLWAGWFDADYAGEYDVLTYIRAVVPFDDDSKTVDFNGKIGQAGIIVVEYDRSIDDNLAWSNRPGNYFNGLYYYGLTADAAGRSAYLGLAADLAGEYGSPDYGCDVADVNAAITKFTFAAKDDYVSPAQAVSYDWESSE